MTTPRRAVIYCRTSTDEQFYYNWSIETQLDLCTQYAVGAGYEVVGDFRDSFTGTVLDRPEMNKLRDFVRNGSADLVICHCIDRLGRDPVDGIYLEREFSRAGTTIEYAAELYPPGMNGELLKFLRLWAAKVERESFLRRSRDAMRTRAKNGGINPGKHAPYGYAYDQVSKTYVICDSEADIVRLIFGWYTQEKLGYTQIAMRLTAMGVTTRNVYNGKHAPASGKWHFATIGYMLRNETYIGKAHYNKTKSERFYTSDGKLHVTHKKRDRTEWIPIAVPAIIDIAMFETAQQQRKQNRQLAKRNTKKPYLMRGRMRCTRCDTIFTARSDSGYYRCRGNMPATGVDGISKHCHGELKHTLIDNVVWSQLRDVLLHPDKLIAGYEERLHTERQAYAGVERQLVSIREKLDNLQVERLRLIDFMSKGTLTDSEAGVAIAQKRQQIEENEREERRLQRQLSTQPLSAENTDEIRAFCENIAVGIDCLTADEQRRIIDLLDVRALATRHEAGISLQLTAAIPVQVIATNTPWRIIV